MVDPLDSSRLALTTAEAPPPRREVEGSGENLAFVVLHSPDPRAVGRAVPLGERPLVVGRDVEGAGLEVRDPLMSRVHLRVAFDHRSRCYRIGDSRSRNGTFVGSSRIESSVLRPNEVVRAGATLFVLASASPLVRTERTVARIASSTLSVLVLGETGSGKERIARSLHESSKRSGRFVAVNCAALPRQLLEAELFGHTRGAFSGAAQAREGLFQTADGGTLFLDEIGDFPHEVQAVLLRVLEEQTVRPVGSDTEVPIDVRVVSATHCDLEEAVRQKRFRADLFARLAQTVLRLPPLRERRAEILPLAREFLRAAGRGPLDITAEAAELLLGWDYPFNVRELQSMMLAFAALGDGTTLDIGYLREHHPELVKKHGDAASPELESADRSGRLSRREDVESLLRRHRGNVSAVAKELGKPRSQVYRWLQTLGLAPDRYR